MKTREEIEAFIREQLDSSGAAKKKYGKSSGKWRDGPRAHHYGKCELKDLVAFIFEGKK